MRKYVLSIAAGCLCGMLSAQQTYTLQTCLQEGLEKNYAIRISKNEQQIAANNVTAANAGRLPSLDLAAGYSGALSENRTESAEGERGSVSGVYDQTVNAGLDLGWTLFDGFRVQTNYKRLEELRGLGEVNARIAIEDFVAGLTAEYYNYVQQKIRLKNFLYAVSLSKERLRIVEARYRIGNFSRLDLQQARVDFNADSSQYINQQELVQASLIRLNELMAGPDVNAPLQICDSLIRVNSRLEEGELLKRMLQTNASLLKADRNTALAGLDLKTLQARNYPYVKLNAGYGYQLNRYGNNANRQRQTWGPDVGATLGITLFDGNRRREQRNARIQIENAELTRQQLELSLRADLADFWQAYRTNLELLKLEEENLVAATENHEIAMERYLLGDLSGIEMREAQKSLLDAEERILSAQYNTKLCEISLQQISGNILSYLE